MPVTVQGPDGNTYQFPDGTDKAAAVSYFKKKGIGAPKTDTATKPAGEGFWESLGHTFGIGKEEEAARQKELKEHPIRSILKAAGGPAVQMAEGIGNEFMRSTGELGQAVDELRQSNPALAGTHAAYAIPIVGAGLKRGVEQLGPNEKINPAEVGTALGTAIQAAPAVADVARPIVKPLAEIPGNAVRSLAGTGSKTTAGLVKDIKTSGAASDAYSKLQAKIETARENALTEGNKKYSTVNEALDPIQADPEAIQGALANATEALKGSHGEPTLLRSMMSKFERGDPWTYEDLQGDYSRLGKELSKGTLPGDEFHAYDVLHEALGDEMQRIADSQGMGEQLKGARDYWRLMKQTFGREYNASDAASGVLQHASPELTQQAAVANRVRLLNSFDPEIQGNYNDVVKASEAAKKTGLPPTTPGESPKINAEDIQARKKQGAIVSKAPGVIRGVGYRLGALWPAIDAIRDVVQGHTPSVGGILGGATGIAGGAHVLAGLLENPSVVEFLTKATPADVAQVPAELRGNLQPIIDAANQNGIKVSPAFGAAVGVASQPKRAGDILRQK